MIITSIRVQPVCDPRAINKQFETHHLVLASLPNSEEHNPVARAYLVNKDDLQAVLTEANRLGMRFIVLDAKAVNIDQFPTVPTVTFVV